MINYIVDKIIAGGKKWSPEGGIASSKELP